MKFNRSERTLRWLCLLLAPLTLTGCPAIPGSGDGTGGGSNNGGGTDGGGAGTRPLPNVCFSAGVGGGATPTGELIFPVGGSAIASEPATFLFRASDPDGDPLAVTVFVSDQANVFDTFPIAQLACSTAENLDESLAIEVPSSGSFFWGIEITDGLNTIQRPADGIGISFSTLASASVRSTLDNVALICPRQGLPARAATTFEWSLGGLVPARSQVFVGRANQTSPFDNPLRIFEVVPQSATSLTIPTAESLPLGSQLTWGLRVEVIDGVAFTLGGTSGEAFTPQANVPPSGSLLNPSEGSVLADGAQSFVLSWNADSGNCEDDITSTVFLERLGPSGVPESIFESSTRLEVGTDALETNIVASLNALSFDAGAWAWAVRVSDGTDDAELQNSDDATRNFRTFVRDTGPRFVSQPTISESDCGLGPVDALGFSFADDNGLDTLDVEVSYSADRSSVFDAPSATLAIEGGTGSGLLALDDSDGNACVPFANGRGFYGVKLQDGANPAVLSDIMEYVGRRGACCLGSGACTEGTLDECLGTYQGDGTSCGGVSCPQPPPPPTPTGACCDSDGLCTDGVPDSQCNGEFDRFSPNIDCESLGSACAPLPGVCCANQECITFDGPDRFLCEQEYGGEWFIGESCNSDTFQCPAPVYGACCYDGSCLGTFTEMLCVGKAQGEWFINDDCGSKAFQCPQPPLGACCAGSVCQGFMSELSCVGQFSGDWFDGEDCGNEIGFSCPLPLGACCSGGVCVGTTTASECTGQFEGSWFGGEVCGGATSFTCGQ